MKKSTNVAAMAFLVVLCLAAAARAADEVKLTVSNNIVFVTRDGGKMEIMGDIYRPDGGKKLPAIVLAHGGGFVAGSRSAWKIPEISQYFAARGYVVFAVDYRLLQQGGLFPNNAQDVKCAIQWLRANAEQNGVDVSRIAVMGMSAGGYMTSFASVTQDNGGFNASCGSESVDAQKPEFARAVAWYGVHDFSTMSGNLVSVMEMTYFSAIKDKKTFKKDVSPITYVDKAPPMLMVHGDADQLVPIQQSRDMCAAMKAAKRECTLVEFPGAGHGFIDEKYGTPDSAMALELTAKWLDEQFDAMAKEK